MITFLRGLLSEKSPAEVTLDVGGIGFSVFVPLSTYDALAGTGTEVTLFTYHHVREDDEQIYGFLTKRERDMFTTLLNVNGIGPKMALGLLSRLSVDEIASSVSAGNVAALQRAPGIGRKIAERMVMELRDRMPKSVEAGTGAGVWLGLFAEAMEALVALGMTRAQAEASLRSAAKSIVPPEADAMTVELLVRTSLAQRNK